MDFDYKCNLPVNLNVYYFFNKGYREGKENFTYW